MGQDGSMAVGIMGKIARIAGGFPKGFTEHAKDLVAEAEKLGTAAAKNDRALASAAIRAIHQTCRDCHAEFR